MDWFTVQLTVVILFLKKKSIFPKLVQLYTLQKCLLKYKLPALLFWYIGSGERESHSTVSSSLWPHGLYSTWDSLGQGFPQARILPSPGGLPNSSIEPRSPALQADPLPAEPWGKPKNTGVGSLSLLQEIFPTRESNWGLLHCRHILYQLTYQGSPQGLGPRFNHIPMWLLGPSIGRKHGSRAGSQPLQHSVIWGHF